MNITQLNKRGPRAIPKSAISKMETMLFSRDDVSTWIVPPFQRPLRVNDKVRAVAEELKANGGFIQGVLTLGKLHNDKGTYIVDGQHRIEAFKISELPEAIADVRTVTFDSLADMAEEFVLLQQALVRMRPDDILRGIEASTRSLKIIRETCPFVGYGYVARSTSLTSPLVSMAVVLRHWAGSQPETPVPHKSSVTSTQLAHEMDDLEVTNLCKFLHVAQSAWGRDPSYARLWSGLNLGLCMWMYRRLVLDIDRTAKRAMILNTDQFKKCLMSISADGEYIDWLSGRSLTDHHRMPCYRRLRAIFGTRLKEEGVDAPKFPSPAWAVS
jgi:hypothetical protein